MKDIVFLALLGSFLVTLTGCGGGSGTSSTQILPLQKGYVLDSPISGLDFECGDITGVTDDAGMFECRKFPVTFKIGNLTIGTVSKMPTDKKVYPQDIIGTERTNFTDAKVIELTRLLQSLDDDGNIDKSINITPSTKKSFTTKQTLSTLSENSQKELVEEVGKTYVSKEAAMTHLKDNIEKLTSIKINPSTMTIELGKQVTLNAQGSYSNGVKKDITSEVTWSSSKPSIATVNGIKAEAKNIGTTTLTATYKGINKTATLTVTEASLISLDINATDTEIAEGTQTKLSVKGTFADETTTLMTTQVTWSSSDITKAIVDANGTVEALSKGTVVITAKKDDITATKTIMISDAQLTAIEVTPQTQSIAKGLTGQVIVTVTYTNGQTQTLASGVDFNSSDESVATVDATGKVTAIKVGTVMISAKLSTYTAQTNVIVTFTNSPPTAISQSITLNEDTNKSLVLTGTDIDNDELTFSIIKQPKHGSFINGVYAPIANYNGSDSFEFVANDGTINSASAIVSISIIAVDDIPMVDAGENETITEVDSYTPTPIIEGIDDTIVSTLWKEGETILSFPKTFSIGEHNLTVTITDSKGATATDILTITVIKYCKKLHKTGQTVIYQNNDDGSYQKGGTRSYARDNVNNIVTDSITGLMWQDDEIIRKRWLTPENYDAKNYLNTSGDTATTYCQNLRLGGYSNWRLPTVKELFYLTDKEPDGYIALDSIFQNHTSGSLIYWSSTNTIGYSVGAWGVEFGNGYDNPHSKNNSFGIRCVRDGQ